MSPISLILSDGMINESLYTADVMKLLAVTPFTLLTCLLPMLHMMSTLLVMPLTMVALHCNINGWSIVGMLIAVTCMSIIGSIN